MHTKGTRSHEHAASVLFHRPAQYSRATGREGRPGSARGGFEDTGRVGRVRSRRNVIGGLIQRGADLQALGLSCPPTIENRSVYDVHHGGDPDLPGELERKEGGPAVADAAVNQAYEGADKTFCFYRDVFERNSIDGRGLSDRLVSSLRRRSRQCLLGRKPNGLRRR